MTIAFSLSDSLLTDSTDMLIEHADTMFSVTLSSGPFEMEGRWLLINLILWRPLIKRGMPIEQDRHLFYKEPYTDSTVRIRIHTEIVNDTLRLCPHDIHTMQEELVEAVNQITDLIVVKLTEYSRSMDIFQIAETMETPAIAAACAVDISAELKHGIKAVETKYKKSSDHVLDVMMDPQHQPNAFYPFLKLGVLNTGQFVKVVSAVGTCTDVDDAMIGLPIQSSYLNGLSNIMEYAVDSLTGKKAIYYNAKEMPATQYTNRKQQLLASIIRYLYPGDCGSTVTADFRIQRIFAKMVLGKNIMVGGQMIMLTERNIHHYYDTTVQMRSVMACRHVDGYCHICGGGLTAYLPPKSVPGIVAAIEVMSPIAQQVLSTKHLGKTRASSYEVPAELKDWFLCMHNVVSLRPNIPYRSLALGMPYSTVEKLKDLYEFRGTVLPAQYFTRLTEMLIGDASDNYALLSGRISMIDRNKSVPYFSAEFLRMLMEHPDMLQTVGNIVWIKLEKFDSKLPIMGCRVVNDSTSQFVRRIEYMFSQRIKDYTTITDVLRDFSNTIWDRATPHLMHLETVLRASMITSEGDYSIPIVEDPNAVMYERLGRLIPQRSIGAQLAYEQFSLYASDPSSFVFPKPIGSFDEFCGFS